MRTNKFFIDGLRGVHFSSIAFEFIETIIETSLFIFFFLRKDFKRTKTRHKQIPTNKTKISEQKSTKATSFDAQKRLRGGKLFILHFGAFLRSKSFHEKYKRA